MLGVIEIVFLTTLFGKHELVIFVLLHRTEHTCRCNIILAVPCIGIGATITGFYLNAVNGIMR